MNAEGAAREAAAKLLISILGKCGLKINSHSQKQTHDDGGDVKSKYVQRFSHKLGARIIKLYLFPVGLTI